MEDKHLTSLEALGIAIRSEIDAQALYYELAARTDSDPIKQRIQQLAKEEKQHEELLKELYQKTFPDVPLKLPPSVLPSKMSTKEKRAKMSPLDVISFAMEQERHAREFYLDAANKTNEPSGVRLLRFLADMEYTHEMRLKAEYEMLIRYPNYFDSGVEPWKPEQRMRKK